jgi:succinate dehydrogenase/fumarate reductase flavoprotein subunit
MANVKPVEELVEADVLCIGGGIAGLMAAIKAGELGAKVVVAEKGALRDPS